MDFWRGISADEEIETSVVRIKLRQRALNQNSGVAERREGKSSSATNVGGIRLAIFAARQFEFERNKRPRRALSAASIGNLRGYPLLRRRRT